MRTDIFIVSCLKHRAWLEHCLASIRKFAQGFGETVVLVPDTEAGEFVELCAEQRALLRVGREPPGKGHLWQCLQKCRADEHCPGADFIFHIDSDCVFCEPVTPADYFEGDKPVLLIEEYASLERQFPGFPWRPVVEKALKRPVKYETMRRQGMVNPIGIYAATRQEVVRAIEEPFDEFVMAQKNEYPQTFCEFNTIGAVALEPPWRDRYHFRDVVKEGWPPHKIIQFWGHRAPDLSQNTWVLGKQVEVVPLNLIRHLLGNEH